MHVHTPKRTKVERISLDNEWCEKSTDELDSYYDAHIIPKMLSPLHKPSHIL